jgi:hypothetical protein
MRATIASRARLGTWAHHTGRRPSVKAGGSAARQPRHGEWNMV